MRPVICDKRYTFLYKDGRELDNNTDKSNEREREREREKEGRGIHTKANHV